MGLQEGQWRLFLTADDDDDDDSDEFLPLGAGTGHDYGSMASMSIGVY